MCVAICVVAMRPAHAETSVEVVGTWPEGETVTLPRNQNFYLHLRYTSDKPVHIWARPYFHGKAARAGSNPSRVYPAGSGEALGWFFLFDPGTQVDEVRISAGDGSYNRTSVVTTVPVSITAGDEPAPALQAPAWVDSLNATDKAVQDAAFQQAMNTPVSAGDMRFIRGFMLAMLALGVAGFAWPAWGLWRWRGAWRIFAAVPAVIMAFVVLGIVIGTSLDPTSHNLWPFEIIMAGAASVAIMVVLALIRKFSGAGRTT